LYQPHLSAWCETAGNPTYPGEWKNWPEAADGRKYSKDDLLDGSADLLAQSLPFVLRHFVSILRYELKPGVYGADLASTYEALAKQVTIELATDARVHLESPRPRYLSPRRYVEVMDAPLEKDVISDLFAAEGAALRAATGCDDNRTFFRLMTLWSAYMHKLGSSTHVYHVLRYLDSMAVASSVGRRHDVLKQKQRVLCTAALARFPFRIVNKGVVDQEFFDSVSKNPNRFHHGLTFA
jgi:hypothetical protein